MYTAAGTLGNKKTIIALSLLIILTMPVSAFAESLTVTTNKDIYAPSEKAIIVGTVPDGAPAGYAVVIKVTGPRGDCAAINILPAADNSFISRPVGLDKCGFGEFTVSAIYAGQKTNSSFTISNSSQTDAGDSLELRMLTNVMLQAEKAVNTRVKELVEGGYVLPEETANKYNKGVSEASLALQAIKFGDSAEAKKHMIFAIRDFREVLNALSGENVARFEDSAVQQLASNSNSDVVGTYRMLLAYYYRLEELAEKNGVDEREFRDAALLLSNAKRMIDENNLEGAERSLERVHIQLEAIRANLIDEEVKDAATYANATNPEDEKSARRLANAADKFNRIALGLLNQTGSNTDLQAKVQQALSLIAGARASIEAQDLESAKDALSTAYRIIKEVGDRIDDQDDQDNNASKSNDRNPDNSERSSSSEGSDNSGRDNKDDDDEDNRDSSEKDDQ